jgi:hypothetical protein
LQPAVANAHAEFDDAARNQANANPSPSDTASSTVRDQVSVDPLRSDTAPSADPAQTADTSPAAVTTHWPDPAINTASAINVAQQPAPAAMVTPSPQLRDDRPTPAAATAPASQLLGERSEPGPAISVGGAPESEASSYSMPLLLGGLAGALALAGLIGFAVVKFGDLSSFMHIRHRSESIWDVVDTAHLPPWQRQRSDIAPTPARDPLGARREIEAQSRDIMEILSRASRGATT